MLKGIGTDIIKVSRVEKAAGRERFIQRVFTDGEQALFASRGNAAESMAGNFAAKEALIKALGHGIDMREAAVLRESSGRPYFAFCGALAQELEDVSAFVSISHEKEYAVATVALEDKNG